MASLRLSNTMTGFFNGASVGQLMMIRENFRQNNSLIPRVSRTLNVFAIFARQCAEEKPINLRTCEATSRNIHHARLVLCFVRVSSNQSLTWFSSKFKYSAVCTTTAFTPSSRFTPRTTSFSVKMNSLNSAHIAHMMISCSRVSSLLSSSRRSTGSDSKNSPSSSLKSRRETFPSASYELQCVEYAK